MSGATAATPPKWWNIYSGDKENRFFLALSRSHEWRTMTGLTKDSRLSQKECEAIIAKYLPLGVIQQHSKEPEKFRYWENATKKKVKKLSLSDEDKRERIRNAQNSPSP